MPWPSKPANTASAVDASAWTFPPESAETIFHWPVAQTGMARVRVSSAIEKKADFFIIIAKTRKYKDTTLPPRSQKIRGLGLFYRVTERSLSDRAVRCRR